MKVAFSNPEVMVYMIKITPQGAIFEKTIPILKTNAASRRNVFLCRRAGRILAHFLAECK